MTLDSESERKNYMTPLNINETEILVGKERERERERVVYDRKAD